MTAVSPRWVGAAILAVGVAGCGGAHRDKDASTQSAVRREQVRVHEQVVASLRQTSHARYGGLPSYLASRQGDPHRVLLATAHHPARTTQGAPVRLRLAGGSGTAMAAGPIVPLDMGGTDATTAAARFTLTFTKLHGRVPLRTNLFGILDEQGALHVPPVHVRRHGDSARVSVRLRLPTGDGKIVYSPAGRPLVTWDYTLETD